MTRPPREVGWVPQQTALIRSCRSLKNFRLFARLEGVGDPEAAVARMVEQTGLTERAEPISRLSDGNIVQYRAAVRPCSRWSARNTSMHGSSVDWSHRLAY